MKSSGLNSSADTTTVHSIVDSNVLLKACKEKLESMEIALDRERKLSMALKDRIRELEDELVSKEGQPFDFLDKYEQLREEYQREVERNNHLQELLSANLKEVTNGKQLHHETKHTSQSALINELRSRIKFLEESTEKKDGLSTEWAVTISKFETEYNRVLEENSHLIADQNSLRAMLAQYSCSLQFSSSASSVQLDDCSLGDCLGKFLHSLSLLREDCERLKRENCNLHAEVGNLKTDLAKAHQMVDEQQDMLDKMGPAFENEKAGLEDQLQQLCTEVHVMNKEREELIQEKETLERVLLVAEEKNKEQKDSAERLERKNRQLREDNRELQDRLAKVCQELSAIPQKSTGSITSTQTEAKVTPSFQQATTKLVEAYERQLDDKNKEVQDLRERVREIEDLYKTDIAALGMKKSQQTTPQSSKKSALSENRTIINTGTSYKQSEDGAVALGRFKNVMDSFENKLNTIHRKLKKF